jgi:hypothetical protein
MNRYTFKARLISAVVMGCGVLAMAHAADAEKVSAQQNENTGAHGFDFEFGNWSVHHRIKRPSGEWIEFEGTSSDRGLNDGSANVEENTFHRPTGDTQGIALRTFDRKTGLWAIWWVDSRDPHGALDPPVRGRFVDGVGTFYSDGLVNGKPQRTRYIWSHITPTSAQWEQAFSGDEGKTWDTNWVMAFKRQS